MLSKSTSGTGVSFSELIPFAILSIGFALAAAMVDYGEWKFGIRSEGLINGCVSFGQKVGNGLGAATASWILAVSGYVGTVSVQTAGAISAICFAFSYMAEFTACHFWLSVSCSTLANTWKRFTPI